MPKPIQETLTLHAILLAHISSPTRIINIVDSGIPLQFMDACFARLRGMGFFVLPIYLLEQFAGKEKQRSSLYVIDCDAQRVVGFHHADCLWPSRFLFKESVVAERPGARKTPPDSPLKKCKWMFPFYLLLQEATAHAFRSLPSKQSEPVLSFFRNIAVSITQKGTSYILSLEGRLRIRPSSFLLEDSETSTVDFPSVYKSMCMLKTEFYLDYRCLPESCSDAEQKELQARGPMVLLAGHVHLMIAPLPDATSSPSKEPTRISAEFMRTPLKRKREAASGSGTASTLPLESPSKRTRDSPCKLAPRNLIDELGEASQDDSASLQDENALLNINCDDLVHEEQRLLQSACECSEPSTDSCSVSSIEEPGYTFEEIAPASALEPLAPALQGSSFEAQPSVDYWELFDDDGIPTWSQVLESTLLPKSILSIGDPTSAISSSSSSLLSAVAAAPIGGDLLAHP